MTRTPVLEDAEAHRENTVCLVGGGGPSGDMTPDSAGNGREEARLGGEQPAPTAWLSLLHPHTGAQENLSFLGLAPAA